MEISQWKEDPARFNSYLPYPGLMPGLKPEVPDRVLDWMFVSEGVEINKFEVEQGHRHVATALDHLPQVMEFQVRNADTVHQIDSTGAGGVSSGVSGGISPMHVEPKVDCDSSNSEGERGVF
jgi:hypothetical protein